MVILMVPEGVELVEDASLDQLIHDVVTVKKRTAEDDAVDLTVRDWAIRSVPKLMYPWTIKLITCRSYRLFFSR